MFSSEPINSAVLSSSSAPDIAPDNTLHILVTTAGILLSLIIFSLCVCFCYVKNKCCFGKKREDRILLLDNTSTEEQYLSNLHEERNDSIQQSTSVEATVNFSDQIPEMNDVFPELAAGVDETMLHSIEQPKKTMTTQSPIVFGLDSFPYGAVSIRCYYSFKQNTIRVFIMRGKGFDFLSTEEDDEKEIYSKIVLINYYKTNTSKETSVKLGANPKFNEMLEFPASKSQMELSSICLQLFIDKKLEGEAFFVPGTIDYRETYEGVLKFSKPQEDVENFDLVKMIHLLKTIRRSERHMSMRADYAKVLLGLTYNEAFEELKVSVITACNLQQNNLFPPDTRVKLYLVSFLKVNVGTRKSEVVIAESDPFYNLTVSFFLPVEESLSSTLIVSIYRVGELSLDTMIGSFSIGHIGSSSATEKAHWCKIITNPDKTIEQWHLLYNLRRFWAYH